MTSKELLDVLSKVTYKRPGYILTVRVNNPYVIFRVHLITRNSDYPEQEIAIQKDLALHPANTHEDIVLHKIGQFLRDFELHELSEWLCFDGKRLIEPHVSPVSQGGLL